MLSRLKPAPDRVFLAIALLYLLASVGPAWSDELHGQNGGYYGSILKIDWHTNLITMRINCKGEVKSFEWRRVRSVQFNKLCAEDAVGDVPGRGDTDTGTCTPGQRQAVYIVWLKDGNEYYSDDRSVDLEGRIFRINIPHTDTQLAGDVSLVRGVRREEVCSGKIPRRQPVPAGFTIPR